MPVSVCTDRWALRTAAPSSLLAAGWSQGGAGTFHPGRLLTASVLTRDCSQGLCPSQTGQTKSTFMHGHRGLLAARAQMPPADVTVVFPTFLRSCRAKVAVGKQGCPSRPAWG